MTKPAHISQQIWEMKYRLKGADGRPVDKTMADTWRRVARPLAEPEKDTRGPGGSGVSPGKKAGSGLPRRKER